MSALQVSGLCKSFGTVPVLRDLALDIPEGSLVAILGASGGGKTTLLRLICGFERADRGLIVIDGVEVDRAAQGRSVYRRPEQRRIGYVAQDGALFPHLSVADNILFGLDRAGRRQRARAEALLELVGLPAHYAARPPQALSGGEQQRVALARALAPEPRLVLLDEPFSALDAALRAGTRQAVAAALAQAGATALLVTHDQSEALSMGDRVGVLRDGRLVQLATPAELYRHPVDAELARFVGEAVLLDARAENGGVACALGRLALASPLPDGNVRVMVRPEQIGVSLAEGGEGHASIASISYYGHDASLQLVIPGQPDAPLLARVGGVQALGLQTGDRVTLAVKGPVIGFPA
jgi:iron(III) transport system ATP-binding protein